MGGALNWRCGDRGASVSANQNPILVTEGRVAHKDDFSCKVFVRCSLSSGGCSPLFLVNREFLS